MRDNEGVYFDWETYGGGWLDFDKTTRAAMKEFLECFVGKQIGKGSTRHVFAHRFDPTLVIKVQLHYETANSVEYSNWQSWKDSPKVAKWLAPCVQLSSSGRVLIQRRTLPMVSAPKMIPSFLADRKLSNYGLIGKQVTCHDYGFGIHLAHENHIVMEPADWWDADTGKHYDKL